MTAWKIPTVATDKCFQLKPSSENTLFSAYHPGGKQKQYGDWT